MNIARTIGLAAPQPAPTSFISTPTIVASAVLGGITIGYLGYRCFRRRGHQSHAVESTITKVDQEARQSIPNEKKETQKLKKKHAYLLDDPKALRKTQLNEEEVNEQKRVVWMIDHISRLTLAEMPKHSFVKINLTTEDEREILKTVKGLAEKLVFISENDFRIECKAFTWGMLSKIRPLKCKGSYLAAVIKALVFMSGTERKYLEEQAVQFKELTQRKFSLNENEAATTPWGQCVGIDKAFEKYPRLVL